MQRFNLRSIFNDLPTKKAAINMYAVDKKTTGQIAIFYKCSREEVERMLTAQGQLL